MAATHSVENQSTPYADVNLYAANRPLQDALHWNQPGCDAARLNVLGLEAGSAEMQQHARLANLHTPVLHTHDRQGRRIDQVEFHPSYHVLLGSALRHRLHGAPWAGGPGAHIERAAAFMLATELEASVLCPVSMTYAATPALRGHAALWAECGRGLADPRYDARFVPLQQKTALTMGMGMTEKQGGSDVRANTTRAEPDGSDAWGTRHRLSGHKWFFSAPMCDAFLVLAQAPQGLSCYFVPRLLPDGSVNPILIQRLKDKLGNHANASSEVEFDATAGWLIGEEGRGIPQILEMGVLTRLDCALGTAGGMRHALSLALHHTTQRRAFGKPLIEQPLMRSVLADLALESEAATALALRVARAVDRTEHGQDPTGHEAAMRRLLTPLAKFWVCKRGAGFVQEAMECLGGNGYVEEMGQGVMARIYREMPVNSIWEGAGNIMALDLLRGLRHGAMVDALMHELAPARGAHAAYDSALQALVRDAAAIADEAGARRLARDLVLLVQASLLQQHSTDAVFAAHCAARLQTRSDVYGALPSGLDVDALIERALPAN